MNAHAVEDFVSFLQASQNGDGVFNGRFVHHNGLKTTLQGRIFFDVFAVFVQSGCADAVQLAPCKHRLQEVACVHAAFGFAGAYDGVQFVDEKQHTAVLFFDFVQNGFQSFFEFAAVFCTRDKRAHVEGKDVFVLKSFRHVAADDTLRQSFRYCRFADARFADKNRVVFGFSGQNTNDVSDFVVTADNRIQLAACGAFDHVVAVFFQHVVGIFGVV